MEDFFFFLTGINVRVNNGVGSWFRLYLNFCDVLDH